MIEKKIEESNREYAGMRRVAFYKFTSPNRAAVPDRLLLSEIPEFLRPIIAQYVRFVEYKATGKQATPAQLREHTRLRTLGFAVDVIDDIKNGEILIDSMIDTKC